jgi:hypothetical protein
LASNVQIYKHQLNISSAHHPQTGGQTKRTHRTIEQILLVFVHKQHDNLLNYLSLDEFSYHNTTHPATKFSPFEGLYCIKPLTPANMLINITSTAAMPLVHTMHDVHTLTTEQ